MDVTYYADTDTLAIVLADGPAARTETPTDDLTLDWDDRGNLIMITVEHPASAPGYNHDVVVRINPPTAPTTELS